MCPNLFAQAASCMFWQGRRIVVGEKLLSLRSQSVHDVQFCMSRMSCVWKRWKGKTKSMVMQIRTGPWIWILASIIFHICCVTYRLSWKCVHLVSPENVRTSSCQTNFTNHVIQFGQMKWHTNYTCADICFDVSPTTTFTNQNWKWFCFCFQCFCFPQLEFSRQYTNQTIILASRAIDIWYHTILFAELSREVNCNPSFGIVNGNSGIGESTRK